MRQIRLSGRIFLFMLGAVLIPLLILVLTSYVSVQGITVSNLETFMEESGAVRQEKVVNDFQTALTMLNEFVRENLSQLVTVIEPRTGPVASDDDELRLAENELRGNFQSTLLSTQYFNSVSLLVFNEPFNAASLEGQIAPSFPRDETSPERQALESLKREIVSNGDEQRILVIKLNDNWHILSLTAIYNANEQDNLVVIGYLLADLNLDKIVIENITSATSAYDTSAYLILPQPANAAIAIEGTVADLDSEGSRRALADVFGVAHYTVGEGSTARNVIAYTSNLIVDGDKFGLVIEVDAATASTAIVDAGLNRIFPFTIAGLGVSLILFLLLRSNIVPPARNLREAMRAMMNGDFEYPVKDTNRGDEIGLLATSFADLRENVRELTEDMNRRLRERTRDVQVTQDIGRAVTAERDLERLMTRVVNLIVQNFPSIYHAQIFMLDEDKQYAVLRASTGQAGRELLSRGHKLGVGSVSVIGQVTEQGQVIIARDTAESTVHRQNEFLGETRAELAIPLRLGEEIIGALDVQSKLRDSFDEDQVAALQSLADQITIAIENARLYAESARLLASVEQERGLATRNAWQQYLYQERKDKLLIHSGTKTDYEFEKLSLAVLQSGKALVGDATSRNTIPFAVPIMLRGQTLGVVEYEVPQAEFNYDKVLLAEELVARLAISMENARLFQSSQQSAERERIVNAISTKLTGQTDIEDILQTAIREVGQALRTPQVAIRLTASTNGHEKQEEEPQA